MPTANPDPPPPDPTMPRPVEGIDYYVEHGVWVFTAAYHLKRGRCCRSGCRHCPYGFTTDDGGQDSGRRDSNPHGK